jgi:hypothetical protein
MAAATAAAAVAGPMPRRPGGLEDRKKEAYWNSESRKIHKYIGGVCRGGGGGGCGGTDIYDAGKGLLPVACTFIKRRLMLIVCSWLVETVGGWRSRR